ncbi:alpha/beta hydrolase [Actinopolymorpha sp. B9G3]|uniref:alpha/beta hydrolase n=1 Tax=Actinopolymorpha sp. B9G3 TaxID=3158970 RepID=UPI0032D91347
MSVCTGHVVRPAVRRIAETRSWRRGLTGGVSVLTTAIVTASTGSLLLAPAPPYSPAEPTAETRFWDLPTGSRLAYTHTAATGERRPTPVILVHGGPGAPASRQDSLTRALADVGFDVYDYHQVGAGLSERLPDVREYTVARHVADLDGIREILDADRLVLVGASWGGTLIAHYLAAHPHRVARAVIDSPGEIWPPAFPDRGRLTEAGQRNQQEVLGRYPRFLLAAVLAGTVGPRTAHTLLPDSQMDGVFEAFVSELDMRPGCSPAAAAADDPADRDSPAADSAERPRGLGFWANVATTMDAAQVADPRPALQLATAPVLVLRAECDYLSWEATREYRDVLPVATLLAVDDAGHTVTTSRPDVHRRLVLAFLLGEPLPQPAYTDADPPW